jgi:hypothetical protein
VLFDIPDDRKPVIMLHTEFTRNLGRDHPDRYLARFGRTVRFYSALRISEKDGTPRAYLVSSNLLSQQIYPEPGKNRIIVKIVDPALRAREPD